MKVVGINTFNIGSTGNIMLQIGDKVRCNNDEFFPCVPKANDNSKKRPLNQILLGNRLFRNLHICLSKITGFHGCFSHISTWIFLRKLSAIEPDIIHLHNIHGWYINIPLLFKYIKKNKISVVWTLHDCWSFTGQCPYFTLAKCEKWKNGCHHCKSYHNYPATYRDCSQIMWQLKRKWFTGVENLAIVTPSDWLADLVKQSYLKDYQVVVINNGIDLSLFKPSESGFREKYQIPNSKKILLGVAFGWGKRKGLDIFVELANRLDPVKYQIVLVGTDDNVDKQLPKNIISIHRTQNQKELAEIYTAADLFVNPTREENYPTVNMEAIACGTPVLTFRTGGSPEILDETCGSVVDCDDIDAMEKEIIRICENNPYSREMCLQRAQAFDMHERFQEYIALYENCINKK